MDAFADMPQTNPEDYLRLLAQHERWLATYVYSLVASAHDAEDVLQEVKVVLWRHFEKFTPGTNFRAWARTIATHQILNYRRAVKKHSAAPLDEAFVEAVATEIDRQSESLERKSDALAFCLRKLPEPHRKVIHWRYYEDCSVEEIAARSQRSIESVYRLLSRIRGVLSECVARQAVEQGAR
jgi:RNA polymerase sigma-70 factor (ECF subfamily)